MNCYLRSPISYKKEMPLTLDKIEVVTDYKHLQIREVDSVIDDSTDPPTLVSSTYHRRVLTPDMDISGETQTIQQGTDENGEKIMKTVKEIADELWTDEVKSAWTAKQAENTP